MTLILPPDLCPLCRGHSELRHPLGEGWWQVICQSCGCRTGETHKLSAEEVVDQWNTRATTANPDAQTMLELADKIQYALDTEGEVVLFKDSGEVVLTALRAASAPVQGAGEPVAGPMRMDLMLEKVDAENAKNGETFNDMRAHIWAAGASHEDADFITRMLTRKGLYLFQAEPWKRCPSTHCERRDECASPRDCTVAHPSPDRPASAQEGVREKSLSDFSDAEIANEHGWRMQRALGDPRIGVGFTSEVAALPEHDGAPVQGQIEELIQRHALARARRAQGGSVEAEPTP